MSRARKILIAILSVFALGLAAGAGTLTYFIFTVEPVRESFTYELGELIEREKTDYLSGKEWAIDLWEIDFSGVDETRAGEYTVTATRWDTEVLYEVIIEDTIAPEITTKTGPFYYEIGKNVSLEDLVMGVTDKDAETQIAFLDEEEKVDSVSPDVLGEVLLTICAWDTSGNETKITVPVVLDTVPVIAGIEEIYLACGFEVDYLAGVTAQDDVDGDVSASVTVNTEELNTAEPGDYSITYSAVDSYGLSGEASTVIHVMEQMDLQTQINTHQLNRLEDRIVGAINLYDSGYYEEDDVDFILKEMTRTRVRIRHDSANGSYSFGSGFIITMDEEEIILCTNQHVVKSRKEWDVYFFDGTKVTGTVIGTNKGDDIGFVRVAVADVPIDTLNQLATVHINKGYWDSLGNTDSISLCMRCINNSGGVWRDRTGKMVQKLVEDGTFPEFAETDEDLWVSFSQFHGSSGSAILDGHGNLIGMSYLTLRYYDRPNGTYEMAVNLQQILDAYEDIVGKTAYYH